MRPIVRLFAEATLRFAGVCARALLALIPPNGQADAAIHRLRTEFSAMAPPASTDTSAAAAAWRGHRTKLRECVLLQDPRAFLTWDVVTQTISLPPYAPPVRIELNALRTRDWSIWRRAIRERAAGLPFPSVFYPLSSSTAIHHGYHLCRFQDETGARIADFGTIVEFGGGYGSMCRIAHNVGFRGAYLIFDVPELSALQRYYLESIGIMNTETLSDLAALQSAIERSGNAPRLLLATWSLSESPVELRAQIRALVENFDAFLFAYQTEFCGIDNCAFFAEWQRSFPDLVWKDLVITQLPGNHYLFGTRRLVPTRK